DDRRYATADRRAPALDHVEAELGARDAVSKLVRQDPGALGGGRSNGLLANQRILRHRARDGAVEAQVERMKLARADRRVGLDGQLGDGQADVTVAVNDLGNRVTEA